MIARLLPLLCLVFSAQINAAEPTWRFTAENASPDKPAAFDLDITGANALVIQSRTDSATILNPVLEDRNGKKIPLSKLKPTEKQDGERRTYDLSGKNLVTFSGQAVTIEIFHDAPPPKPFTTGPSVAEIAKLPSNPRDGRGLLGRGTCLSCHVFQGIGGDVGPELTKIGSRLDHRTLVEAIADPSALHSKGFESIIVETKDGTPHLGFIVTEDKETVSVKDSAAQVHEIDKNDIVSRKQHPYSLMPPFADVLTPQQIANLASYLAALKE